MVWSLIIHRSKLINLQQNLDHDVKYLPIGNVPEKEVKPWLGKRGLMDENISQYTMSPTAGLIILFLIGYSIIGLYLVANMSKYNMDTITP